MPNGREFVQCGLRISNLSISELIAIEDHAASIDHAHKKTLRVARHPTKTLGEAMMLFGQYRRISLRDEAEHLREMVEIIICRKFW